MFLKPILKRALRRAQDFVFYKDGEFIIDLIGGTKDRKQEQQWQTNTLVPVFSTTKAVTALVIAWLYDTGRLDYEQTVASFWPEFGVHGKDELTIAQALCPTKLGCQG